MEKQLLVKSTYIGVQLSDKEFRKNWDFGVRRQLTRNERQTQISIVTCLLEITDLIKLDPSTL